MNWYKAAAKNAVSVTPAEFGAMDRDEKEALARKTSLALATQRLFFTEEYRRKEWILEYLAQNPSIHPEAQPLFFTEQYEGKSKQYEGKSSILRRLAQNTSITPATQFLFFTQEYRWKAEVLDNLVGNKSFLKGDFNLEQLLLIRNAARGAMRLRVLSKRLEQIQEAQ